MTVAFVMHTTNAVIISWRFLLGTIWSHDCVEGKKTEDVAMLTALCSFFQLHVGVSLNREGNFISDLGL